MKHLITTIFALLLLTNNTVFAAEEQELVTWQVFLLPVARDNNGALQWLLKESTGIQITPESIKLVRERYQLFSNEELAKIDAAAIKALDQFGFKGYEWSNIQNAVIDEPNRCIIYYPSVNYKTFKVQKPYVWAQTDKLTGTLKSSLDSLGWSSGDQKKNITLATKIGLATPKNFEDAIWHVFLLPCYRDSQDVKCLLENNLGIKIDISELTEKDFWTQDTKNIDEKLAQKMLSMGFQAGEWIKKDTDSYRDPNLRVMIYSPVARPKALVGNFAWGKIDEKTGPDKFRDMLKSTGWPSAKDDKKTLLEIITGKVPLLYWTSTIYIAKDKGTWNVYLRSPLLFTSSSAESETGADILLHEKLSSPLEAINFVYNDGVKTDKAYTAVPADPFVPASVPTGFAYTAMLAAKLPELVKLGTTYLGNRLMANFSGALKTLVKA